MKHSVLFHLLIASVMAFSAAAQDLKPTDNDALLNVFVVNSAGKPQENEVITFVSQKEEKSSYTGTTNAEGKFSILIPKGEKYKVQYKVFSTEQDFKLLDIPAVSELLTFDYTITVKPPKVYTLENVLFDPGKSTLNSASYEELNKLKEYMSRKKSMVVEIAGHTDNTGNADANMKLSEQRAVAVRDYLLKNGIAPERVIAKGYGDMQPVADNATPEGRKKNRRTEARIISE